MNGPYFLPQWMRVVGGVANTVARDLRDELAIPAPRVGLRSTVGKSKKKKIEIVHVLLCVLLCFIFFFFLK